MPVVARVLLGCGCLTIVMIAGAVVFGLAIADTIERREHEECVAGAMESLGPGGERVAGFECTEMLRSENADLARWIARNEGSPTTQLDGVMRIDDATLGTLFSIRRAVADVSVEACANQWDMSAPDAATRALGSLSDEQLRQFSVATVALLRAAMEGTTRMTTAEAEVVFVAFITAVQEGPLGGAIAASSDNPTNQALACGATRALFSSIDAMPEIDRVRTMRAWLVYEASPAPQ